MAMTFDGLNVDLPERTLNAMYERRRAKRRAYVGTRNGAIKVDGRNEYIWVRAGSLTGPEYMVRDSKRNAPRMAGTPIQIQELESAPGQFEVVGTASDTPVQIEAIHNGPARFSFGGPEQIIVDHRQIRQGLLRHTDPPGMTVQVGTFIYYNGTIANEVTEQETAALSAPGAGLARWDAISVDISDNTLQVTTGDTFDKSLPEIGVKPSFPAASVPLGYTRLDDTTTSIRTGANLFPVPPYFTTGAVGVQGGIVLDPDTEYLYYSDNSLGDVSDNHAVYNTDSGAISTINGGQAGQIIIIRPDAGECLLLGGNQTTGNVRVYEPGESNFSYAILANEQSGLLFNDGTNWSLIGAQHEHIAYRTALTAPESDDLLNLWDTDEAVCNGQNKAITVKNFYIGQTHTPKPMIPCGRLTLETGVPVSSANQTGKGTLYYTPTPDRGDGLTLYDSGWKLYTLTERSLALSGLTASKPHDIFLYDNSGTLTLEGVAWTNDTTRATALATQDGVYVKNSAPDRRYLGTIYVDASKQCTDAPLGGVSAPAISHVWNYYNRVRRTVRIIDTTVTWLYNTATWRLRNGSSYNVFNFVHGLDAEPVFLEYKNAAYSTDTTGFNAYIGVGLDWSSGQGEGTAAVYHPSSIQVTAVSTFGAGRYENRISAGRHTLSMLEIGDGSAANLTWLGDAGSGTARMGAFGAIWM